MKITKRQLKRIIREASIDRSKMPERKFQEHPPWPKLQEPSQDSDYENAEYERGYQDGLDSIPPADNATTTYDAGYEDGQLDAELPDAEGSPRRLGVHEGKITESLQSSEEALLQAMRQYTLALDVSQGQGGGGVTDEVLRAELINFVEGFIEQFGGEGGY